MTLCWIIGCLALLGCSQSAPLTDPPGTDAPASPDAPLAPDGGTADGAPDAAVDGAPDAGVDAPAITGDALQLNDVSQLFPLATSAIERDVAMLAATSAGPRGPLLPSAVYGAVGPIQAFGSEQAVASLRVVALRLDPCFAELAPSPTGAGCAAQLRLVLQPISEFPDNDGRFPAFDAAVHTFYRLSRAEVYALKDAVVALRLANTSGEALGPLAPHPILVQQGLGGPYGAGLRDLILGAAGRDNLVRVATLSSETTQAWSFRIFDITDATTPVVVAGDIAGLPAGVTKQSSLAFTTSTDLPPDLAAGFDPAPTDANAFNDLASTESAIALAPAARLLQLDNLLRTENPRTTTPETVACASCHFAMIVKKRVAEKQFGPFADGSAAAFVADPAVVSAPDLRATFTMETEFNIHAFSYNNTEPAIVQRVVNESAAILEYFATSPSP